MICPNCGMENSHLQGCIEQALLWDKEKYSTGQTFGKTRVLFDQALKALEQGSTVYIKLPNDP